MFKILILISAAVIIGLLCALAVKVYQMDAWIHVKEKSNDWQYEHVTKRLTVLEVTSKRKRKYKDRLGIPDRHKRRCDKILFDHNDGT